MQTLAPGALLQGGKYRIKRVLGQGGFGITYLAEQEMLDRQVAIKEFFFREYCGRDEQTCHVTLGTQTNKDTVERFLQKFIKEAKTISKLHHSGIIEIYDIFMENNTAYYVMEYIEGESLGDIVKRRGALPEVEALRYIRETAEALAYIHSRNINHLDIKPNNLMLRSRDGKVVVIDFGVSKQYDENTKESITTTPVGISHGYSPVEQYKKNGVSSFSPQSDIYSLGATLYKLLTGVTPPEAIEAATNGLPQIPASVSPSVKKAVEASMSFKKDDRPQTISSFLSIIDAADAEGLASNLGNQSDEADEDTHIIGRDNTEIQTKGIHGGHEWVDLGLPSGTKWATMNVGASSPSDYGSYFAWGETSTKSDYTWETLKYRISGNRYDNVKFSKYVTDSQYGTMDGKWELDLSDDAAYVNWGSGWRMPTKAQLDELREKCRWTWTTMDGHNGSKVVGPNGNFIFLPAAGYRSDGGFEGAGSDGSCWSASLYAGPSYDAYFLYFFSVRQFTNCYDRYDGRSVRAVLDATEAEGFATDLHERKKPNKSRSIIGWIIAIGVVIAITCAIFSRNSGGSVPQSSPQPAKIDINESPAR